MNPWDLALLVLGWCFLLVAIFAAVLISLAVIIGVVRHFRDLKPSKARREALADVSLFQSTAEQAAQNVYRGQELFGEMQATAYVAGALWAFKTLRERG